MLKKIILKLEGMHCSSCALSIDFALEDLGVKSKTSYLQEQTDIEFDPEKYSEEKIIETIKTVGYDAKLIS